MLSIEQMQIINKQLTEDNASEFVNAVIMRYCTNVLRITELLELIPKIAGKGIKERQERINEYYFAMNLLLGERCRYPIPKRKAKSKKEYNPDFPTLLYVAKAYFPHGICDGGSQADREFFAEFIQTIKDKQGFDYESKEDWKWIEDTANCKDWFLSVIIQNIDENFSLDKGA